MHTLAFLHLVAAQTASPPGTLTIGEGVALAILTAVVGVAAAYGLLRAQVSDLRERVGKVEAAASPLILSLARVEVRLDNLEKGLSGNFDSLRRELHLRTRGGDE